MSPLDALITTILAAPKVKEAINSLTKDTAESGGRALIRWLRPSSREKAAKKAIEIFSVAWNAELERTSFEMAYEGYRDQLRKFLETNAREIAELMTPEAETIDLSWIEPVWSSLPLEGLPTDFSWARVAKECAETVNKYFKNDPEMRAEYSVAQRERTARATERTAAVMERWSPIDPGLDLDAYRKFLIEKECNVLQLAVLHPTDLDYDRKLVLWSVFVEPLARESIPFVDTPPELLRLLRHEGHLPQTEEEEQLDKRRKRYESSPIRPVFEILNRERLVVITGDPGSGKTSLLKYRALQWANGGPGLPIPLLIYLREYARSDKNLIEYCQSGKELFHFGADHVDRLLKSGEAAFYLDGLDEVFDTQKRDSLVAEIIVLSVRYPNAKFVITSRKIGYDPDRLRTSGFLHATIEDFDRPQIFAFLRLWHPLSEPLEKERGLQQQRMERAINESPSIRELAGNPLLLTMMAVLNRTRELPRARVTLYKEASRVLLEAWDTKRALPVGEFDLEDKEALLRGLAGEMQQTAGGLAGNLIERKHLLKHFESFLDGKKEHQRKAKELVKQLTERNFILSFAGADRFCFVHRTFLEYFCASWFKERLQVDREITPDQLRDEVFGGHWRDEKWHEVLRLIAGMVSPRDAAMLIEFLMEQNGVVHDYINLTLAAGCLNEIRDRTLAEVQAVDTRLWEILTRYGIRVSGLGTYMDYFAVSTIRRAVLKMIASTWRESKAYEWLLDHAGGDLDDEIRIGTLEELVNGWPNHSETYKILADRTQNDADYTVRRAALQGLARIAHAGSDPPSILIECARKDKSQFVQRAALHELILAWPNNPETISLLRDRAQGEGNQTTQLTAIETLSSSWRSDPDTLYILKDRIRQDQDGVVRQAAIEVLSHNWHADPETLSILKDVARNDKDHEVRLTAIEALEFGWPSDPEVLALRNESDD